MKINFAQLENLSPKQAKKFWHDFEQELASDEGEAAKRHLAAGHAIYHAIYYGDERYPKGVVKEYPNHRKQLVQFDENDNEIILREL